MNGAEHYREAERLLEGPYNSDADETFQVARAQVHATLALAGEQPFPAVFRPSGSVGNRVRGYRESMTFTQTDLAKIMVDAGFRWHQQTVVRVEEDKRPLRLDEGIVLAELFGVGVAELAGQDAER